MRAPYLLGVLALARCAWSATVTADWTIDWVEAAPDGFSRPVVGINNEWPCPMLQANVGDTVIVTIHNNLGNETTGLHWHGIRQYGSPEMDGPVAATQCSVPPGSSFTYQFVADLPGTFWYHSHEMGQYPDGLRGPFIVHDPNDPYTHEVDEDIVLTMSDWYHSQSIPLVQAMLQPSNTLDIPPIPNSLIINEGGSNLIPFQAGKTYRIRMINFSALAAVMVTFGSHPMKIIMQDASYITPASASLVRISPAQRYDILITASGSQRTNDPFLLAMDANSDYTQPNSATQPVSWNSNITGYLVADSRQPETGTVTVDVFNPVDDSKFKALTTDNSCNTVTQTIQLDFDFCTNNYSIPQACFNGQPYVDQLVPTLYSAVSTGQANTNPLIYGGVNPFVVPENNVVELVVNNLDSSIHPFHLHGHQFQVLSRPPTGAGKYTPGSSTASFPTDPASRDTVSIFGNSYAVLRFKADNPGVWLFHCHIEWHVEMGLTATIVEAPEQLRGRAVPQAQLDVCRVQGVPTAGNAAGHTGGDVLDTKGMLFVNPPTYTGALWEPTATPKPKYRQRSRVIRHKL